MIKAHGGDFDPVAVQFFKRIIAEYDFQIVFSTSWRKIYEIAEDKYFSHMIDFEKYRHLTSYEQLKIRFMAEGFDEAWFHKDIFTKWKLSGNRLRGYEIQDWLEDHSEITKYIIVDDMPVMLSEQKEFFVNTCGENGLTVWEMRTIEKLAKSFQSK